MITRLVVKRLVVLGRTFLRRHCGDAVADAV